MNCKRCGANIPPDATICQSCGLNNPTIFWQGSSESSSKNVKRPSPSSNTSSGNVNSTRPQSSSPSRPASPPRPTGNSQQATAAKTQKSSSSKWILGIIAVIVAVGCIIFFSDDSNRLKGSWEVDGGSFTITFSDDKNGYITAENMSYEFSSDVVNFTYFAEKGKIEMKTQETLFAYSEVLRFEFEINGDMLEMTELESGEVSVFYKVD